MKVIRPLCFYQLHRNSLNKPPEMPHCNFFITFPVHTLLAAKEANHRGVPHLWVNLIPSYYLLLTAFLQVCASSSLWKDADHLSYFVDLCLPHRFVEPGELSNQKVKDFVSSGLRSSFSACWGFSLPASSASSLTSCSTQLCNEATNHFSNDTFQP